MNLHFYSRFPVYWPLKVLYNTRHIHPFIHSYIDGRGCHASCRPSGAIWGSVCCSRLLSHAARRIEPVPLWLLDDPLCLLSHSHPMFDCTAFLFLALSVVPHIEVMTPVTHFSKNLAFIQWLCWGNREGCHHGDLFCFLSIKQHKRG